MSIESVAKQLWKNAEGRSYVPGNYPEVDGVPYTFPFHWLEGAPYDMHFSVEQIDTYHALHELLVDQPLPNGWGEVIKEATILAKENGVLNPVDIIYGTYFVIEENKDYCKEVGIEPFESNVGVGADFTKIDEVKKRIDAVVSDSDLRQKLIQTMSIMIPDQSPGWLNFSKVAEALENKSGILVDIGCGVGIQAESHAKDLHDGIQIIGVDRQYHPQWYKPWLQKDKPNLAFVRADGMKGLPFGDSSINYAMMEFVADHVTEDGLTKLVQEASRVLKTGGVLFVGPQVYDFGDGDWRVYKKIINKKGEISFRRISFKQVRNL